MLCHTENRYDTSVKSLLTPPVLFQITVGLFINLRCRQVGMASEWCCFPALPKRCVCLSVMFNSHNYSELHFHSSCPLLSWPSGTLVTGGWWPSPHKIPRQPSGAMSPGAGCSPCTCGLPSSTKAASSESGLTCCAAAALAREGMMLQPATSKGLFHKLHS